MHLLKLTILKFLVNNRLRQLQLKAKGKVVHEEYYVLTTEVQVFSEHGRKHFPFTIFFT